MAEFLWIACRSNFVFCFYQVISFPYRVSVVHNSLQYRDQCQYKVAGAPEHKPTLGLWSLSAVGGKGDDSGRKLLLSSTSADGKSQAVNGTGWYSTGRAVSWPTPSPGSKPAFFVRWGSHISKLDHGKLSHGWWIGPRRWVGSIHVT